jgi:biotin carboxylase
MKAVPKTLLLFAATTGYQIREFASAGERLGIDVKLASDRCLHMDDPWGDGALPVRFDHTMAETIEALRGLHFDGVAAVGDGPAEAAAVAAEMFGASFHPPATAHACRDKFLARQIYEAAGMRTPWFFRAGLDGDAAALAARAQYPCVLKPLGLSASRGVIRANTRSEFEAAFRRIAKIAERHLQVEGYIPGREFAVEGLVTGRSFQALAIFDKPDPLEGPFFEETIYVTPSREPATVQRDLLAATERAALAMGFRHGPVHAELRHNAEGAWMLEMHARPIGGLCARSLRFAGGMSLEELILRHAIGENVSCVQVADGASGVMMIPIPKGGIYEGVEGLERVRAVTGIEDVIITATEGQRLVPLPEGASYLGFIFARAESAAAVEAALRQSHAELRFRIATVLETFRPRA